MLTSFLLRNSARGFVVAVLTCVFLWGASHIQMTPNLNCNRSGHLPSTFPFCWHHLVKWFLLKEIPQFVNGDIVWNSHHTLVFGRKTALGRWDSKCRQITAWEWHSSARPAVSLWRWPPKDGEYSPQAELKGYPGTGTLPSMPLSTQLDDHTRNVRRKSGKEILSLHFHK